MVGNLIDLTVYKEAFALTMIANGTLLFANLLNIP